MTSNRPPESTSSRVGWITVSTTSGVRTRPDRSSTCSRKPCDRADVEACGHETDRTDQTEDQRRQRQDREERRLGGQTGDPIADADGGGRR